MVRIVKKKMAPTFAEHLRTVRKARGLTQAEFGSALGVHPGHISRLELGTSAPSNHLVKLICRTFRVHEAWLLEGRGPMEYPPDQSSDQIDELRDRLENTGYKQMMDRFNRLNRILKWAIEGSQGLKYFKKSKATEKDPRMIELRRAKKAFDKNLMEFQALLSNHFDDEPKE